MLWARFVHWVLFHRFIVRFFFCPLMPKEALSQGDVCLIVIFRRHAKNA